MYFIEKFKQKTVEFKYDPTNAMVWVEEKLKITIYSPKVVEHLLGLEITFSKLNVAYDIMKINKDNKLALCIEPSNKTKATLESLTGWQLYLYAINHEDVYGFLTGECLQSPLYTYQHIFISMFSCFFF